MSGALCRNSFATLVEVSCFYDEKLHNHKNYTIREIR